MLSSLFLTVLLCLIVGNTIDTGNVCVVRAAGDLTVGKPGIAVSCLLTVACAAVVFYIDTKFGWQRLPPPWTYPNLLSLAGAAIFAAGALVNGACAIGTIGRLARGDLGYFATIVGGIAVASVMPRRAFAIEATPSVMPTGLTWLLIILAVTAVLMVLFRRHLRPSRLGSYAILGVVAAMVTNLQGDWTWLSLMQEIRAGSPIQYSALACVAAVLVGATLTAVSRRRFKLVRPDPKVMLREATGGGLMAAGAILIPGGNDSLLVYGVPSGSPNALAAYFVMFALMLAVLRIDPVFRRWAGWTGTKS